jgi:hypothetical protein
MKNIRGRPLGRNRVVGGLGHGGERHGGGEGRGNGGAAGGKGHRRGERKHGSVTT